MSLTQAANSDPQTINCLTQGVSHALERPLENQLPLRWDESVTACHVQGITAAFPMFYSALKNYKVYFYSNCKSKHSKVRKLHVSEQQRNRFSAHSVH